MFATFSNATSLTKLDFTSYAVPNAPSGLFGTNVASGVVSLKGSDVQDPHADNGTAAPTPFNSATILYGLTNRTSLVMEASPGGGLDTNVNIDVSTIAHAVPEPGSMTLMAMGVLGMCMAKLIRGRRKLKSNEIA